MLNPAYLQAADPLQTQPTERYFYPEPSLVAKAAEASTAFLRVTLAQPSLTIRPLTDDTLLDWKNLPNNTNSFMWHQQLNLHPANGHFGFAVYNDDLLCGMALNSFVERPLAGDTIKDVLIELVEKNSYKNPLSGYVLSTLCEASRAFASISGADRLLIFTIDSPSVMNQFPHMGFTPDIRPRSVNAVLDLRQTDGIDWRRFLQYRATGNRPTCSPQNPSI